MIGAAVVLYILVGYPGLLGLAFILLEMILLHQLNHLLLKAKSKAGEFTDKRLKLTTNIIEGIRIIKLYSWEESYS